MATNLSSLEQQLRAVANARRLQILKELKKNTTMTVTELSKALHLSMAPTSQHLRVLRAAGIVEQKKRGKFMTYRLSLKQDTAVKNVLASL